MFPYPGSPGSGSGPWRGRSAASNNYMSANMSSSSPYINSSRPVSAMERTRLPLTPPKTTRREPAGKARGLEAVDLSQRLRNLPENFRPLTPKSVIPTTPKPLNTDPEPDFASPPVPVNHDLQGADVMGIHNKLHAPSDILTPPLSQFPSFAESIESILEDSQQGPDEKLDMGTGLSYWDLQEQRISPETLGTLTPALLKFITSASNRRHIIRNVSVEEFEEWQCRYPGVQEDQQLRYSYNGLNKAFIIECSSSYHDAFVKFLSGRGMSQISRITGNDECGLDIMGTTEALVGFQDPNGDRGISRSRKIPDGIMGLAQGGLPNIVIEVGFSEKWCDLIEDAKLYLTKTDELVEMVVILEINEQKPSINKGNMYYNPKDGEQLSNSKAFKQKLVWPEGFAGHWTDPNVIAKLREYFVQQSNEGKLIPRLVEAIDCSLHIFRLKPTDGDHSTPSFIGPACDPSTIPDNTLEGNAKPRSTESHASTILRQQGEASNLNLHSLDEPDISMLERVYFSKFVVNDRFVETLPPSQRCLSFIIRQLVGSKKTMPEHLAPFADECLNFPLDAFFNFRLMDAKMKMIQSRAFDRATALVEAMERVDGKRKTEERMRSVERIKEEGLASGSKDTRKERAKRDLTYFSDGAPDVMTHAQIKKHRAHRETDEDEVEPEEAEAKQSKELEDRAWEHRRRAL